MSTPPPQPVSGPDSFGARSALEVAGEQHEADLAAEIQADEGELAIVRFAEVELDHADFAARLIDDCVDLDLRMLNDLGEMRLVERQP